MSSKAKITQRIMKIATKTWEIKSGEQLDSVVKLFMEVFGELAWENQNSIEQIREGMLHQIAGALTPDSLAMAKPANTIVKVMPLEPVMELNRKNILYLDNLPASLQKKGLKTLSFSPVMDHIKLVRGEIKSLLCERNLYRFGPDGEKELFARASSFNQDLNRSVWIGFDLDKRVETLKDIHFYIDFPQTLHRYELYDLLKLSSWSIDGKKLTMESGISENRSHSHQQPGGIFSYYNTLNSNDGGIMDLYRKQFLHITSNVRTATLEKSPFPPELALFFPDRINELPPQYWIKVVLPAYFKSDDIEDIVIHLNAFPVSNKDLKRRTIDNSKSLTGIITLSVAEGEYYFAVDNVTDSQGREYNLIPYASPGKTLGGTYTLKKGNMERFSTRDLADTIEQIISLFHTELARFNALKIDNLRNTLREMEEGIASMKNKLGANHYSLLEVPTYLIIDAEEKDPYIYAEYWTSNCELANGLNYGTILKPLEFIPIENNSCILLKTTKGGKAIPKNEDMLAAYKLSLTSHEQLYSAMDYENYCRMRFAEKIQHVKIRKGIACGTKNRQGLIRTIDICLTPSPGYRDILEDPVTQGELLIELEKRSSYLYNFRVIIDNNPVP